MLSTTLVIVIYAVFTVVMVVDIVVTNKLDKEKSEYNALLEEQNRLLIEQNTLFMSIILGKKEVKESEKPDETDNP